MFKDDKISLTEKMIMEANIVLEPWNIYDYGTQMFFNTTRHIERKTYYILSMVEYASVTAILLITQTSHQE